MKFKNAISKKPVPALFHGSVKSGDFSSKDCFISPHNLHYSLQLLNIIKHLLCVWPILESGNTMLNEMSTIPASHNLDDTGKIGN